MTINFTMQLRAHFLEFNFSKRTVEKYSTHFKILIETKSALYYFLIVAAVYSYKTILHIYFITYFMPVFLSFILLNLHLIQISSNIRFYLWKIDYTRTRNLIEGNIIFIVSFDLLKAYAIIYRFTLKARYKWNSDANKSPTLADVNKSAETGPIRLKLCDLSWFYYPKFSKKDFLNASRVSCVSSLYKLHRLMVGR